MKLIKTKDESFTLFNEEYNDVYHSKFGAIKEALYQFIYPLKPYFKQNDNFEIFEIGFGLGYNFLVTKTFLKKNDKRFSYKAVEKDEKLFNFLLKNCEKFKIKNYCGFLKEAKKNIIFEDATKIEIKSEIIYHDGFSPSKNKELWTFEFLSKLKGKILVTYTSNPKVRVSLILNDFLVLPTFRFKGKGTLALNKNLHLDLFNFVKFDLKEALVLFSNYAKPYGLEIKKEYPVLFKGGKIKIKDKELYNNIKEIIKMDKKEQILLLNEEVRNFWL